jgi:hypothetical protein
MSFAYNPTDLYHLAVTKEVKRWYKQDMISQEQYERIKAEYTSRFFHPNFMIRILLFVAALIGLSGVTGIMALILDSNLEKTLPVFSIVYGILSFVVLDRFFIANHRHYKSGLTEALLYHSCLFTILGLSGVSDYNEHFTVFFCIVVLSFAAWRYLDLLCSIGAIVSLVQFVFMELDNAGGILQQIIPFAIIMLFTPLYFAAKQARGKDALKYWHNNLIILEGASLLLMYAAGNYFVVRELSAGMMNLHPEPDQDIPFAFVFYVLTAMVPIGYLYFGIRNKDIVLLRVSLIAIAFSVFTFKYYFSLGHPAITITLAGIILTGVSLWLMKYLKVIRHGFTRENHLPEKWADMNVEALVISQTMGGNQITEDQSSLGGGGDFDGGGATTNF